MKLFPAFPEHSYFGVTIGTFCGNFVQVLGIFLVTILVLHTLWTIVTLDLVRVSLSGRRI